jgi:acyl-CoA dehydrogenase
MTEGTIGTALHGEIRGAVRELCRTFDESYWQELDATSEYPERFVGALTAAGWLSIHIPVSYGGGGMGITESSIVMTEINQSGANGSACHAQMYGMFVLLRSASDELKAAYLPKIAEGRLRLQAFGVTEPDAGSDTASIRTKAVRDGDRYRISGQKVFTSRLQHSDLLLLLARTSPLEDGPKRTDGMSLFLVDLNDAGAAIRAEPIRTMINHETNMVFIDDLSVPEICRIGDEGRGFYVLLDALNAERILIAAECIGDGHWFVDRASDYARNRVVFGRPIGMNQGVSFPLARCRLNLEAAASVQARAATAYDGGTDNDGFLANAAKYLASEAAIEAGDAAMTTFGGWGMTAEYGIERKFRETRLFRVAPVTNNLILAQVSHRTLGLPRSY